MATTVRYHRGLHFCADLESGRVFCDAFAKRGKEYPSAPELLMVSLGSCIGAVILTYADRHAINFEGMEIDLDWDIVEHPHRIGRIDINVRMPGPLTDEQTEVLKRVAETCLIHNTLLHAPEINLDLTAGK
ncbi:MAG: OsmC family protein [Armatimonadota bacterium]|nr:MAG: OsmC family protein [Armatimonadota bacterium]